MKLELTRYDFTPARTIGRLNLDGWPWGWVLEDAIGPNQEGFAIPPGHYPVELTPSARVQAGTLWSPRPPVLPLLLHVPNRSGIRIHAGNHAGDTTGCPVVGYRRTRDTVYESRLALTHLVEGLFRSLSLNEIIITEEH